MPAIIMKIVFSKLRLFFTELTPVAEFDYLSLF